MAKWNCSKTEVVITNHNAVITDEVKAIIKIKLRKTRAIINCIWYLNSGSLCHFTFIKSNNSQIRK